MIAEHNAETFSNEDASNVVIPCSLSAILYELLQNIKSILTNNQRSIKLFEVCSQVCELVPDFLVTGDRLTDIFALSIQSTIKAINNNEDMISAKLLRS